MSTQDSEGWNTARFVDRRKAAKSYRPQYGTMSASLRRAREPFRIPNAITGILIGVFVVGVYTYSIRAVRQENFDDIDEAVRTRTSVAPSATVLKKDEERKVMEAAAASAALSASPMETQPVESSPVVKSESAPGSLPPRGLFGKSLVWGAPPVDNIGTLGQKSKWS